MDAKSRKALIDSLADAANFDALYTYANQRWMIGKALAVIESRNSTDSVIKSKTKDLVTKAKVLVTKHRDFKIGIKLDAQDKATKRLLRRRRVEILYGMFAFEPDLIDSAHEKQLLFVAKRRYRAIERFQFYINPNGRGYLRYDDTCPANQTWRVNVDAAPLWVHVSPPSDYPIKMVTPPDPPDILKALGKIFISKKVACEGNIFDCATALSIVYMDSLLEAKTPKTLLEGLYARAPPTYLCIDHVNRGLNVPADVTDATKRNKFFISDMSATALFNKDQVPKEDLQVGDHIYIWNHGLYKRLRPRGAWQGEHALVTDCGNRAVQDDNGFRFMGHGMPRRGETGALPRFYAGLLNELNTLLFRYYRMGGIFLFYLESGGTAFPGHVTKQTATLNDMGGTSQTVDFYFFDLDFNYRDNVKKAPKGKSFAKTFEHGFVGWHIAASREIGIHEKKTLAAASTQGIAQTADGVRFTRLLPPGSPAEMFDPLAWDIPYPGTDGTAKHHNIYQKKGAGMEPLLLEMSELYSEPFYKLDPALTGISSTRPLVDVGASYTSFLTSSGAV